MRDDFDHRIAERFRVLDQVPVPDTWSRVQSQVLDRMSSEDSWSPVQFTEEVVTMIDLTPAPTEAPPKRPIRLVVAAILAAAAVAVIAVLVIREGDTVPADDPSPSVTVSPPTPSRALFGTAGEQFVAGTYFVDTVEGSATPRISVSIGDGWRNTKDGWGIGKTDVGFITFSRPDRVFTDACNSNEGFHPGPVTTLDGLVSALTEQGGWVDVTTPSDISIDGYVGKALHRTAPSDFVDCDTQFAPFRSWENEDENGSKGWSYYEPGEMETLWVVDVGSTIVILNARALAGEPATALTELAAVLDTIRISTE